MHRYGAKIIATIVFAIALTLCCVTSCASAPSSTYSIESVRVDAQVQTDATLHIVEHRLLNLAPDQAVSSGAASASAGGSAVSESAEQPVSLGPMTMVRYQQTYSNLAKNQAIGINDIRVALANEEGVVISEWTWLTPVEFQPEWRNGIAESQAEQFAEVGSYTLDPKTGRFYVLFRAASNARVMLELDYNVLNGAQIYKDAGDVSFKYINDTELTLVRNVTCVVSLPVPEGQQATPNANVYAWGHGPADGVVKNTGAAITFETPLVKPNQYAEAHVMFPRIWLMNAIDPTSSVYRDELHRSWVLDAEKKWQDTWRNASMNDDRVGIAVGALCLLALLVAVIMFAVFKRERKPSDPLSDEVLDLAQAIHPAIAVRLENAGRKTDEEFAATVVRLRSEGKLEACREDVGESSGCCLKRASFEFEDDTIDATVLEILETLGLNDTLPAKAATERVRKNKQAFLAAVRKWRKETDEAYAAACFEDIRAQAWGTRLKVCALLLIGLAVFLAGVLSCYSACALLVVTSIGLYVVAQAIRTLSQRGIDVLAALSAASPETTSLQPAADDHSARACDAVSDEELVDAVLTAIPAVFDEAQTAESTVFTRMRGRFSRTEKR